MQPARAAAPPAQSEGLKPTDAHPLQSCWGPGITQAHTRWGLDPLPAKWCYAGGPASPTRGFSPFSGASPSASSLCQEGAEGLLRAVGPSAAQRGLCFDPDARSNVTRRVSHPGRGCEQAGLLLVPGPFTCVPSLVGQGWGFFPSCDHRTIERKKK